MTVFRKLERQALELRDELVEQAERDHNSAVLEQLNRSVEECQIITVRMTACRMATEPFADEEE